MPNVFALGRADSAEASIRSGRASSWVAADQQAALVYAALARPNGRSRGGVWIGPIFPL